MQDHLHRVHGERVPGAPQCVRACVLSMHGKDSGEHVIPTFYGILPLGEVPFSFFPFFGWRIEEKEIADWKLYYLLK